MQQPDLTLIVAAYNSAVYLERFFASLKAQTYQGFNVVFVDDASTDGTYSLAQQYGSFLGARLRMVQNECNGGLVATRNAGLDYAAQEPTEYLSFLDADDWFDADYVLDLYTMARATDADLCVAGIVRYNEATKRTLATEMVNMPRIMVENSRDCAELAFINPCSYAKFFKTEAVGSLRFRDIARSEDTCYLFDALPHIKRVAFTNAAHYYYSVHPSSLSASFNETMLHSMHAVFADMAQTFNEGEHADYKDMFEAAVFVRSSVGGVLRAVSAGAAPLALAGQECAWLDTTFPGWHTNPYLTGRAHTGLPQQAGIVACAGLYKIGAFPLAVQAYQAFVKLFDREVRV